MIVREGEALPRFYGFAYRLYDRHAYAAFLFPFNHVVAFIRSCWFRIRDHRLPEIERQMFARISRAEQESMARIGSAYDDAAQRAYQQGVSDATAHAKRVIRQVLTGEE